METTPNSSARPATDRQTLLDEYESVAGADAGFHGKIWK